MKAATILTTLINQLKASTDISYVSDASILLGVREKILNFPAIIIEPTGLKEANYAWPKQRLTMNVGIIGYIQVMNAEKQIVGDTITKGIMDFENDVKLALDSDRTLGGQAINLTIVDTSYDFVDFPYRSFTMNVEILFEQVQKTR